MNSRLIFLVAAIAALVCLSEARSKKRPIEYIWQESKGRLRMSYIVEALKVLFINNYCTIFCRVRAGSMCGKQR